MNITISQELRTLCPGAALGILHYSVEVSPSSPELLAAFEGALAELAGQRRGPTMRASARRASTSAFCRCCTTPRGPSAIPPATAAGP